MRPEQPNGGPAQPNGRPVGFVGRHGDLGAVADVVAAGGSLVLTGAGGVGKTRLASETAARFRDGGWTVVMRHATPALQELPLGLFSDLIDDGAGTSSATGGLARAYRSVTGRLSPGPALLIVDDAPLVDPVSALLIQRVIENGAAAVLATCRSGDPLPGGLATLLASGALGVVELAALDDEDALALAGAVAADRLPRGELEAIVARADGLPLFVVGLVYDRLRAAGTAGRSDNLEVLVGGRFGRITTEQRESLELIALGAPLELATVDRCCRAEVVEQLERQGLIAVSVDGRRRLVGISHPLYSDAVTTSLGPLRRRRLLRTLATEAEANGMRRHDDLLRTVLWRLDAGDGVEAAALVSAARRAVSRGGVSIAERLLGEVLGEAGAPLVDADVDTLVEAACLLANIRLEQGRPADTVAICAAAPAGAADPLQARLALIWWIAAFHFLGDIDGARELIERSVASIGSPWDLEVRYNDIALEFYAGTTTAAVARVDAMLAEADLPERTWVWFMGPGVVALAINGRVVEAVRHAEVCTATAGRYADDVVGIEAHAWCAWAFASTFLRGPTGCLAVIGPQLDAATRSGDHVSAGLLDMVVGFMAFNEGRLVDALDHGVLPLEIGGGWALFGAALRAQALALAGRRRDAREALGSTMVLPQCRFHHALNRYAEGEVQLAEGDPTGAEAAFVEGARHAGEHGQHLFAAQGWLRALGTSPQQRHAAALADAAHRVDGGFGAALAAAAAAWSSCDVAALEAAAAALEAMGHQLHALHVSDLAVDLLATQPGARRAYARARQRSERRWARARRPTAPARRPSPAGTSSPSGKSSPAGAPSPATRPPRVGAAAARPAQPVRGAPTGADARTSSTMLTARERQIVELAAAGLTDQAIAEDLDISLRTVHAHLRNAYQKLGVSGRRDLGGRPHPA